MDRPVSDRPAQDAGAINALVGNKTGFAVDIADGGGADALARAIADAPLSAELKRLLWVELLDTDRALPGENGVLRCTDLAAGNAGDFIARVEVGRTGEAMIAALRALSLCAANKISLHHSPPSESEITPKMIEAGKRAFGECSVELRREERGARERLVTEVFRAMAAAQARSG